MIWVEVRLLAFIAIFMFTCIASEFVLDMTHASGLMSVITYLVLVALALAVHAAFRHFDRGRRARYAPALLKWLGITSGAAFGLWQAYDLARSLHNARDVTSLVTGLIVALLAIGAVLTRRRRRPSER